ncbi:hypothetical protein ABTY63_30725 [Streptomyces solisilvae]|uniref:Uncharacterized protein n=3 Tax=Streptomyces TaxID=1883 RepID=A0ABM6H7I7_9ACTN|nr:MULTISPECIES: hypothetical protein [Streptomyces]AQA09762.1 hypothetical protein BV401_03905 [Streptomyces autolyticus]ATL80282.1 hypothetical protein SMALA_0037 [Streptomyces malaysiensis]AUA16348.1 hypothetical protein CFP59_08539 [Streptomyces sp. M56]MCD9587248.1 hypothetical protein [Streptomyces sp. 8ZJF_21]MCM3804481.1 hypothetical protein [Streptomyces sp. DR7-3]
MGTGMRWRTATAAVTTTLAGTLGLGLMSPVAHAAGHGPCYDGRCKTTVSRPTSIKVDSHRFGFGKLRITHISSRSVKMSATTTGGARLSGSTSPGGTVRLNNLSIRVQSASGHKAKLVLTPAS